MSSYVRSIVFAALYAGMTTTTCGVRVPRDSLGSCVVPTVTAGTPSGGIERDHRSEAGQTRRGAPHDGWLTTPAGPMRSPPAWAARDRAPTAAARGSGHAMPMSRVVPGDAALGGRVVVRGHAVADVGDVARDQESVREADRHPQQVVRHVVELERLVAAERRRAAADVDDDVQDGPACGAHELSLAAADREVHARATSPPRPRVVVLHELLGEPQRRERVSAEGLDEEASLVAVHVRREVDEAGEAGRDGPHRGCPGAGRAGPRRSGASRGASPSARCPALPRGPWPAPRVPAPCSAGRTRRG